MLPEVKAVVFIPLTQGKVAVVDFEDFETVRGHKWFAHKDHFMWYALRGGKWENENRPLIRMHRVILNAAPGALVDHKDGDGLNNCRINLRIATPSQNQQNRKRKKLNCYSRFRGVTWHKRDKKWQTSINHVKHVHLGYFDSEEAAARAYDKKALELFGEFAVPNFP